jgi:CRP-like cAMP-binding protein
MDFFFQCNKDKFKLSEKAILLLKEQMEILNIEKNETFLHQGSINTYVYFVSKGLVRTWFLRDSKEYILCFSFDGELSVLPLDGERYSLLSATTIEDSVILRISKEKMESLFTESIELALWGYNIMKTQVSYSMYDYLNLFWMEKKEIYKELLNRHPDILQRISLKDIAAYINVTQSSLSRIRAEVKL